MHEVIEIYPDEFLDGCSEDYRKGYDYAVEWQKRRAERRAEAARRRRYFLKQKLIGAAVIAFTALAVKLMDGDATIALVLVPLGLALMFSKDMLWTDKYYFEVQDREARR